MNTDPVPFVPDAQVPSDETLKVLFRPGVAGDSSYVMGAWHGGWQRSMDCRWMTDGKYKHCWHDLVVGGYGVMQAPWTRVLVGCSPSDREWIWCFCVFTPATGQADPVIHWLSVRPSLRDGYGAKRNIRRKRLATLMLAAGGDIGPGVKDRLTYTCRPGLLTGHRAGQGGGPMRETNEEQETRELRELRELETSLIVAAKKIGVTASHMPLASWLAGGGR